MEKILDTNTPTLNVIEPMDKSLPPSFILTLNQGQAFKSHIKELKDYVYTETPTREGEMIKLKFRRDGVYFGSNYNTCKIYMDGYMYLSAEKATKYEIETPFVLVFDIKDLVDLMADVTDEFTFEMSSVDFNTVKMSIIRDTEKKDVMVKCFIDSYIESVNMF